MRSWRPLASKGTLPILAQRVWRIDRWAHLPNGATAPGSAAHYYRLHETVTSVCLFAAKVAANSQDLLCVATSQGATIAQ
jgi:hypothetical protein